MFKRFQNLYIKYQEMTNYLIFGVLTTAVNWIIFQVFNATLMLNWSIANVIAWIGAVVFAYITNRKYVFQSASRHILKEFLVFVQFRLVSLLLEMLIMYILIELITLAPFLAKVITAVAVVIANYIFSKLIVFKERRPENGSD
ncbi:hypothetical protein SDC9_145684 [bioreactor metagenome]|uniref:GtrA/DPMS transmembrane domain-containing protein n=1 Tax=bioreactor metagenome TaxID=1076179 RepID=A0A645EA41_9ZZZZ